MTEGSARPSGSVAHPIRTLFADQSYRRIWLAGALASTLRWGEMLAISLYVLHATGSASAVALVTFVRLAPMFALGLIWGVIAERFDRRRLLLGFLLLLAAASALLWALAASGALQLWHVVLGTFLVGVFFATEFPVRRTMVGEIAGPDRLGAVMSLEAGTSNAIRMLGPSLGGLIFQLQGLAGTYALSVVLYTVAALFVWRFSHPKAAAAPSASILATVREGLAHASTSRAIRATFAVTIIVNVFGFAYIALAPVVGERVLGLSASANGLLLSAEGLGALFGALAVGAFARKRDYGRIYLGSSFVFMAMVLLFALSRSTGLSLFALLISGVAIAGFASMQSTLTFLSAPPAMRARIMGLLTVCIGTGPLGMLHAGWLADGLGAAGAITTIASEGLIALGLAAWKWPELWRPLVQDPPERD
jgi:MFS family permease